MARCIRNKPNNEGTVTYARHRYKGDKCKSCGISQVEQHRALVNRRSLRKAARSAQKRAAVNPMIYA